MSNFNRFLPCLQAYGSTSLTFFFFFFGSSSLTIILTKIQIHKNFLLKFPFIDQTFNLNFHESKLSVSVPLAMASSDTSISPYDDVNKFFVFVPSARIFGSRSSGVRFAMRLMSEDQKFVAFGAKIGARIAVGSDFLSLVMTQGT
jgi:hypothetical protein